MYQDYSGGSDSRRAFSWFSSPQFLVATNLPTSMCHLAAVILSISSFHNLTARKFVSCDATCYYHRRVSSAPKSVCTHLSLGFTAR